MAVAATIEPEKISNFGDANAALRDLGVARRRQEQIALSASELIAGIKKRADADAAPWIERDRAICKRLGVFIRSKEFAKAMRDGARRTFELTFGVIGIRANPPFLRVEKGFTEEDVIAGIKRDFPKEWDIYVQVRESLRRDELKDNLGDALLARLGLAVDQRDTTVIEPRIEIEPNAKEVA